MIAALGPDPLRADADPTRAWAPDPAQPPPIGDLLMDQTVLAGVGNVYRAEVLFRHRIHPLRPGRTLRVGQFRAIWDDLVELMREGVRTGRIDTVRPEHTPEAMGRPPRVDDHGGEVYVYRRTGQPCLVCGVAGAHRGAGRTQSVLVSAMSARVPLAGRTARRDHISDTPRGRRPWPNARAALARRSPCASAGRCRSRTGRRWSSWCCSRSSARSAGIVYPDYVPSTVLLLPMFIGSLWLGPRSLPWFIVFVLRVLLRAARRPADGQPARDRPRGRDLRDRAADHGRPRSGGAGSASRARWASRCSSTCATASPSRATCPTLPREWLRRVGGEVGGRHLVRRRLHRGQARPRTTSSSWSSSTSPARASRPGRGRCSSPVRSTASSRRCPGEQFLPAANDYLLGQDWGEGFATAIHLHLDLATGDFELRKAGHPPAVWLHAGSGSLVGAQLRRPGPRPDRATPSSRCIRGRL